MTLDVVLVVTAIGVAAIVESIAAIAIGISATVASDVTSGPRTGTIEITAGI
jgi:hypothetical protein